MTSKIVVNNIEADAGINTVTISGDVTATNVTGTHHGSAANLTSISAGNLTGTVADARISTLTASKLTGTLPAISATNLTNLPAANLTGTLPAISGANLTNLPASGKATNLVVNGAMLVAQRGTSSTGTGYETVDRFKYTYSGTDNAPTQAQVDVASGTTPYTLGFRKAYRITNANQTSVGVSDRIRLEVNLEAQDIANSGWNYTSSSSYVTLSFWCKSSVAQNFYGNIRTPDGTSQQYSFETGSLTADTWTKVTKTIPGNSNLTFDNNAELGWNMDITMFMGTNNTTSGNTMNQWYAYDSSNQMPDNTATWYTTNGATWEITGLKLEVGDSATDFEHLSFTDDLRKCHRYFQELHIYTYVGVSTNVLFIESFNFHGGQMRSTPSITGHRGATGENKFEGGGGDYGCTLYHANNEYIAIYGGGGSVNNYVRGSFDCDAEL